ncbi:hypothetical protein CC80DRAFT_181283 [Byssothecium circinans]|uniref:Alpha-1,3-mannosyltransferase CMT1 n=1 Tax=Byssothecium circinans TaxID=147558 RepID=A0A6A5TMX9_9PLEO|nr:hypothetical protein CC80DRAFT_181283 [Byssothecium circinans]
MLSYLSSKRQSRSFFQAFVILTVIIGFYLFARDSYWYGAITSDDEAATKGAKPMTGILPEGIHATGTNTDHSTTTPTTKAPETQGEHEKNTTNAESTGHAAPIATSTRPVKVSTPTPSARPEVKHPKPELPLQEPNSTLLEDVPRYIKAILDPFDTEFDRLSCPTSLSFYDRYSYLRSTPASPGTVKKPKYYFALDLYKIAGLLPRLMNSIIESIKFLGPEDCVLSIVEGRSDDGTYEILLELAKELEKLGIKYILQTSDLDPKGGERDRIDALAELRNLALNDLIKHPEHYAPDTTVVFSNDVSMCVEDILELVHQKALQNADMMCGMDWNLWEPLAFYDSWVGRGINGDLFIKIIQEGDQMVDNDAGIFWNHPVSRQRHDAWKPLQVFACWNGITVFTAKPIMEHKIKFRYVPNDDKNECYQSEPNLFAKDMWFHGYGKIAVVPTVNLAYSDGEAKRLREQKGWLQQHLVPDEEALIDWTTTPPAKVVCVPWLRGEQTWHPWNQGLPGAPIEAEEKKEDEKEKEEEV